MNSARPTEPTPVPVSQQEVPCRRPVEQQAAVAKLAFLPAALASALGIGQLVGATGYRRYMDDILRDAGAPKDPVEIMLLEQLAVCHLRAAQLQGHAGQAETLEAATAYNAAAARLVSEIRKMALALKEYRGK